MGTEIGDDELRTIGSQSRTAQCGSGKRTAGRLELHKIYVLLEIENVNMIDVCKIKALAFLIIEQKLIEGRI